MFDNSIIKAPNQEKPHIVKIGGLWRVSQMSKLFQKNCQGSKWLKAHNFVAVLNRPLLEKMFNKENKNE